ncbi:sulfatase-like hydrolase/transferase [Natrinema altunense]|uniref:Sulfatase n=1 Tax=Natrinema altunense TaxID=222984 RepID=A0A482Y362_9EURY|nr:sulfatase-like hydrolase/transferase [Natrinema altunense]RZH68196.1 sulfatase [Natrinema altunense]
MSPPNVLLIVLDSVRARNTSLHGYHRETTPVLDRFAEGATWYTQARAPGIHSITSHVSLFTGYAVAQHRATDHGVSLESGHTIWEMLSEQYGYETGLFTPNSIVAESSNLADFFDRSVGPKRRIEAFPEAISPQDVSGDPSYVEYVAECLRDDRPLRSIWNGLARLTESGSLAHAPSKEHGGIYAEELLEWVDDRTGPWAACLNLMDAHYPYVPDDEYDRWGGRKLRAIRDDVPDGPLVNAGFFEDRPWWQLAVLETMYDGCIRQADAYVGELLTGLRERGAFDDTLVVVTADHGEGFGEPSVVSPGARLVDHNWGIDDVLTHVPLVVKQPDQRNGEAITDPVSLAAFPSVVERTLEDDAPSFVSDEAVLTTCYRLEEPDESLSIPRAEQDAYLGPWHARYRPAEQGVETDVHHRGTEMVVHAPDPRSSYKRSRDPSGDSIESTIDALERVNIVAGERALSDDVETRLEELGYR